MNRVFFLVPLPNLVMLINVARAGPSSSVVWFQLSEWTDGSSTPHKGQQRLGSTILLIKLCPILVFDTIQNS
jgi:hypothetical protein